MKRDTVADLFSGYGSDSTQGGGEDENPFEVDGYTEPAPEVEKEVASPSFVRRPKRDGSLAAKTAPPPPPPAPVPFDLPTPVLTPARTFPHPSFSPTNSISSIASDSSRRELVEKPLKNNITTSNSTTTTKQHVAPPPRYQSKFRASPPAPPPVKSRVIINTSSPIAGPSSTSSHSSSSSPSHSRTPSLLMHQQSSSSTSHSYSHPKSHLRNRSGGLGSSGSQFRSPISPTMSNPFEDSPRLGFEAAFMSQSNSGHSDEGYEEATARGVRGERAEWLPTQQHLYSASSLAHDDPVLRSGPNSASSHSHGSSSQRRYDVALLDPKILADYQKGRYTSEADDRLHDVGNEKLRREGRDRRIMESDAFRGKTNGVSATGCLNLFALLLLGLGILMVFGGYPILTYYTTNPLGNFGAANIGGTNGSGQVPDIAGFRGLIDKDTPADVLTRTGFDGKTYQLQFSDEFNTPGRTFEPGMDPYFTAVDLHYWQTNNLEWYDPGNIITEDGYLAITLTKEALADSHGLGYLGGLLTSWNQFCFTGGYIEVAVSLPGDTKVSGLWPAAWTMSNLGRAGYGGSLDGTWPYSYNTCDIGTLPNQTDPTTGGPAVVTTAGDPYHEDSLSYLGGQKLSACTCLEETDHPGPKNADGTWVGRGATEIDIFEATVNPTLGIGDISQSGQWAPFNPHYAYINTSTDYVEFWTNKYDTEANAYQGGVYQQVTSGLSKTDPTTYNSTTNFMKYGFEWKPSYFDGTGTGWITWTQDNLPMWKLYDTAMGPNKAAQVGQRDVPNEPHYILLNLGMSENFGTVDFNHLTFPATMRVDYVRVYQDQDYITSDSLSCDPAKYPTAKYIAKHPEAYMNPNITLWSDMGLTFPKNRLTSTCT